MKVIENTAPSRGNGVTVMMNGQIFCSQPPVLEDQKFIQQAVHWIHEYQKGHPNA